MYINRRRRFEQAMRPLGRQPYATEHIETEGAGGTVSQKIFIGGGKRADR
jgi:hypothetical protein